MSFFKRAWLSITRRKGKSILLFIILFILGNVIAGAISIKQATQNVEEKIKKEMGAAITIDRDYRALEKEYEKTEDYSIWENLKNLDLETMETIGQSSYIKYFDYSSSSYLGADDLKAFIPDKLQEEMGERDDIHDKAYFIRLKGVQYPKVMLIEEGKAELYHGRVFTEEEIKNGADVVLVTKKFAQVNYLKVDDNIVVTNYFLDWESNEGGEPKIVDQINIKLKIIGIYEPKKVEKKSDEKRLDGHMSLYMEQEAANLMIVPNQVCNKINIEGAKKNRELFPDRYEEEGEERDVDEEYTYYEPIYILKNSADLEKFKEETQPLLPPFYIVKTASDNYKTIAAPVEAMSKMSNYILIVAIIATIMIVTLVILLFLRDRKHELGIYLSFGERKIKVLSQIVIEVILVAFIAITLSIFTGNIIAKNVSDTMIQKEIEKQAEDDDGMRGGRMYSSDDMTQSNVSTDDVVEAYKVEISLDYILIFYLVGLGSVVISTVVPLIYVVRLNPKKIMM